MRVIEIEGGSGPAEALKIAERPDPVARPGQVLIRVRAAGVNRPDLLQRTGAYPPPPGASDVLGLEIAGEIEAVGEGVTRWAVGDRV
ncbi:alcohol dehydrogenase catalytic domain-containing protein, partial [Escherichia coli]|nr:alcohol dehydrogenase catalytic domain-containing protein [Escherichia coli]